MRLGEWVADHGIATRDFDGADTEDDARFDDRRSPGSGLVVAFTSSDGNDETEGGSRGEEGRDQLSQHATW